MIVGSIGIVVLLLLLAVGVPIGVALLLVALVGIQCLVSPEQVMAASASSIYHYVSKYSFSVIPMFVFMGHIGAYSGLFREIFEVARRWAGRLPMGLAVSTVIAQTIFGACSGSSAAACVVIGKVGFPVMRKMKYPDTLSTGVIAGSGTLAALIPPSVAICVYGLIVDESIGKLLIGGILPGLMTAGIYIVLLIIQARNVPRDSTRYTWKERFYAIRYLWIVVALIIAIMGGIYSGLCTPTEGGAVGAFTMFMLALMTRNLNWNIIWQSIRSTVITSGMLLIMLIGALLFARFLTLSGFSRGLIEWVCAVEMPRFVVFLLISGVYLFFGCFVGGVGMMVMSLPMFYPLMMELGYDSIWFGIVTVMFMEVALETPPVGVNLFATKSVVDDVPITTIIRGTIPFIFRDILAIMIVYIFPQIVTFLPSLM